MSAELGLFALILAFFLACTQAANGYGPFEPLIRRLALAQFCLISIAFLALIWARVTHDFSVMNVAEHSSRSLPTLYLVTGAWGNHEGSMLLWVWVLTLFGALLARSLTKGDRVIKQKALAVQGGITAGFLLFILLTSNPFARLLPPPMDGRELNPLLQDIGLALHPPLLYLGYVGFSVVFALSVAGLLERRISPAWARETQPWILGAWSFLTFGIGLGSWWAYRELGWGGWWFWDPVENASLLPWLAGTALLHSNLVLARRGALASWVPLLAILTFSLSLLGTFLVRSGLLTSVHSFASDPARGLFIISYMVIVTGGALLLYAVRAPSLPSPEPLAPVSREGMIVLNNLFLLTACASVLLGTLYPLFTEWLGGARLTVGPPYFNATLPPLMIIPLILAAIAPVLAWKKGRFSRMARLTPAFAAALAGACFTAVMADRARALGALGIGLSLWLGVSSLLLIVRRARAPGAWRQLPASLWAVALAHLGAALLVAGITASALWSHEAERLIHPQESVSVGGYRLTYDGEEVMKRSNHSAKQGTFTLLQGEEALASLRPEFRKYAASGAQTSEAALYSRPWGDVYAVIGESARGGGSIARIYVKPMMQFIWMGFIAMGIGGMIPLLVRRKPHGPV